MSAIAIQDVWQAIRESERSDEFQFMDDELLIKAEAPRVPHNLQDLFSDRGSEPSQKSIATQRSARRFRHLVDGNLEFSSWPHLH